MTKSKCRKCGLLAEHYAGIATHCKECWKARVRANRAANADHYRAFDRVRGTTPERKAMYADKQRRKRKASRDYDRAHKLVADAVRSGRLVRPDHCTRCLINCDAQGHHDDHSRPLEVMWLCPICHAQRHVELAKMKTTPFARHIGGDG